jgi:hypothetical protein
MGIAEIKENYSNYIIEQMIKRLPNFDICWEETNPIDQLDVINILEDAIEEFIIATTDQMMLRVKKNFDDKNSLTK